MYLHFYSTRIKGEIPQNVKNRQHIVKNSKDI